jgi:hypothetical protein
MYRLDSCFAPIALQTFHRQHAQKRQDKDRMFPCHNVLSRDGQRQLCGSDVIRRWNSNHIQNLQSFNRLTKKGGAEAPPLLGDELI